MPLWGANGAATSNAPIHVIKNVKFGTAQTAALYMNTSPSAYVNGQVVGLYGVSNVQVISSEVNSAPFTGNSSHTARFLTPGWWTVKQGMGPVASAVITNPGGSTAYVNGNILKVTSVLTGTANTSAVVTTNASGNIVSLGAFSNGGGLFVNSATITVAVTNSTGGTTGNGVGATFTVTLGGRAGRIRRECLVTIPSMTSSFPSGNSVQFPNI